MKQNQVIALGVVFVACFASGCAKYNVMALEPLKIGMDESELSQEGIHVCCRPLDKVELKRYFNKDLRKVGVQPVQFAIENEGNRTVLLEKSGLNLPTVAADYAAERAHFNTAGRATGYGVAGIFIWPLLIPAIVDGVGSSDANAQMDRDFAGKELDEQALRPFDRVDGVFYVPVESFKKDVVLRLVDRVDGCILEYRWHGGVPREARLIGIVTEGK